MTQSPSSALPFGRGPSLMSYGGMVAAAHPLAAESGAHALRRGGNAFDAAVAVAAALNVVEPFMSGLAGMGYATMWIAAERQVRVLDFVPPVPASFPATRFSSRNELARGPMAVGLPGNLAGWWELHRSYGRLDWAALLEPVADLAERGFPLAEFGTWEVDLHLPDLRAQPALWPAFIANYPFEDGVQFGQGLRQKALADTLRLVAAEGAACLYGGTLGRAVVAHLGQIGGCLTMADLVSVQPRWVEPLAASYGDIVFHLPPPPCEGFQILLALKILEGSLPGDCERNGVAHLDRVIRAIRLAAGERIAHNNPDAAELARLFSAGHVAALRARLDRGEGLRGAVEQWMQEPDAKPDFGHTTSFSVADADGNLVCITQSLGSAFGSGVVVPGTGVCLNNFLHWADVQPASPNRAGPGSPLTMCMAPGIATRDGQAVLALGTPGSYGILQTTVQALVQLCDFALGVRDAVEAPRMRLWDGAEVEVEDRIGAATVAALQGLGHAARPAGADWTMRVGGMQAVQLDPVTGRRSGAADPRRDGYVIAV